MSNVAAPPELGSATIVHLGSADGVLEAVIRLRQCGPGQGDLVVAVPAGAPVLANPIFLDALRATVPGRAVVLVTDDDRGRAMASGQRLPAYASLSAYASRSVDPTERLEAARRAALARLPRRRRVRLPVDRRLSSGIALALVAALAVLAPSADVVVAATPLVVGPVQLEVRTAPSGAIPSRELSAQVSVKVQGTASGSRKELTNAAGAVLFKNLRTDSVTIPAGTRVWAERNVRFRTTETRTLPASVILPLIFGSVLIPIEAEDPGPGGNVGAETITNTDQKHVVVTNPAPTTGGQERRIPIVRQQDYAGATTKLEEALDAAAREQLGRWKQEAPAGLRVEDAVARTASTRTPLGPEVVGSEVPTFELEGIAQVRAYAVPEGEPRQSAVRELERAAQEGYALAPESVALEVTPAITDDGIAWLIQARGTQRPRLDEWGLRLALWGVDRARAETVLAEHGLRLVSLRSNPEWWPRLPLLPLRIAVRETSVSASR